MILEKLTSKQRKDYYEKVARIGCILCQKLGYETTDCGCELHHVRTGNIPRKNAPVIPLCAYHHRLGNSSVHQLGHKGFEKYWGFSEMDLLERLNDLLQEKS